MSKSCETEDPPAAPSPLRGGRREYASKRPTKDAPWDEAKRSVPRTSECASAGRRTGGRAGRRVGGAADASVDPSEPDGRRIRPPTSAGPRTGGPPAGPSSFPKRTRISETPGHSLATPAANAESTASFHAAAIRTGAAWTAARRSTNVASDLSQTRFGNDQATSSGADGLCSAFSVEGAQAHKRADAMTVVFAICGKNFNLCGTLEI